MKRTPNFKSQSLLSLTIFYIVHVLFFFPQKFYFIFLYFFPQKFYFYILYFFPQKFYIFIFLYFIFFFLKSFIFLFYFSSKVLFYIFINQLLHQMEKRDSNIDSVIPCSNTYIKYIFMQIILLS